MTWTLVGAPSFASATGPVEVGPVRVPLDGGLCIKVDAPVSVPAPYGFLVLSYRSTYGEELGRIMVWPRKEPTVYRMGEGMKVRDPFGVLVLEPKTFNRRWLVAGFAVTVRVLADLPTEAGADALTPPGFADPSGRELLITPTGGAGRLTYPR